DYLVKILPNSFAAAMEANYDASVLKTGDVEEILITAAKPLQTQYSDRETAELARTLAVDYFIYGSFTPLDDNTIEITVYIFNRSTQELLSFTNTGKMETEIFNLVDRVTAVFNNFIQSDYRFKTGDIDAGARLAFITNLTGDELNDFYITFMQNKYSVRAIQGNEVKTPIELERFNELKYLSLKNRSFERVRTAEPIIFRQSAWNGKKYLTAQKNLKNTVSRYFYQYPALQEEALKQLSKKYSFDVDYLFIVGFDDARSKAWVRVFDMRKFTSSLVWLQTGITPAPETKGTAGIAQSLITLFKSKEQ
ncbi:MAG: hypothetical protein ACRCUT_01765, partial [Spirochaetota bacterium]